VNDRDPSTGSRPKSSSSSKALLGAFKRLELHPELSAGTSWVVHGYSNDIINRPGAQKAGMKFRIATAFPKKVRPRLDAMVIAKGAPRRSPRSSSTSAGGPQLPDLTNMIGPATQPRCAPVHQTQISRLRIFPE
jgi:hypothetical protein